MRRLFALQAQRRLRLLYAGEREAEPALLGGVETQSGKEREMPVRSMTEREIFAAWLGLVIGFVWGLLCAILGLLAR